MTSVEKRSSPCRDVCDLPIGVFDSGVGGLTVLSALHATLPHENLIYLGDTARVPYGTKSPDSIRRYASQAAGLLVQRGIKLLVVACNTASAVALEALSAQFAPLPVIGVVQPGARAGCEQSVNGVIAVIGTESTISGGAYQQAIQMLRPDARVVATPCSLLVALAEEGWFQGAIVEAVIRQYLEPMLRAPDGLAVDSLVLGCTHFPVLSEAIRAVVGPHVALVDSARTTSDDVAIQLASLGIARSAQSQQGAERKGSIHILVTDGPERFARVAGHFFNGTIDLAQIEQVDLQLCTPHTSSGR